MNSTTASSADGLEQLNDSGISDQDDLSETEQSPYFYCCQCKKSNFISRDDYECHLKSHVRLPKIIIQPLKRSVVANIKAKRFGSVKRKSVAIKHIRSYIVPQNKNNPLKLTIKLASESKRNERSFEVVTPKVLSGPGEQYSISVGGVNCVKIENLLPESENKAAGVEGSSENTEATATAAEESEKGVQGREGGNGELEDDPGASEDHTSNSPQSDNPPNDTDFEPATGSFSPNMVEVNGASLADSTSQSPGFPTSSPNPPDSEQHQTTQFETDNGTQNSNLDADPSTLCNDNSAGLLNEDSQHSNSAFAWNDVTTGLENMGADGIGSAPMEERDPLMLPSQPQPTMGQNESTSILGLGGPPDGEQPLDGNESMLRGFLCEQTADKSAVPVSNVGNIEGLGLGTEYISLERLGEGSGNVLYCDVCGEQASSHASLEEHRTRACHFKCTHSDCGGMVFLTSDELLSHQNAMHGGPPPPYHIPHHQVPPAPVQQLAQQVQRLPVPMSHQPQLHNILSQAQSSQQFVQQQVSSPTRRPPPPLYRGPSPSQQQYTTQHVVYGQQPNQQYQQAQQYSSPPLTSQQQNHQQRAYNVISQQQSQQRVTITQRGPAVAGLSPRQVSPTMKRVAPVAVGGRGSPNSKQRRLDVLIPDRHDDADCHVIAMQKRTESGPIIGNVQSAANSRPESMIHLTDSITLSVRQNQGSGANGNQSVSARGKSDAKAVANILATRGITVTPAGDMVRSGGQSQQQQQSTPVRQVARAAPAAPQQVPTLNLNAAISIIRTDTGGRQRPRNQQVNQAGGFAVPQGRSPGRPQVAAVERPPRPPTVDLTGDGPAPVSHPLPTRVRGRGRGMANSGRFTCQVCDKIFSSQETLSQHMNIAHRSPNKLPYRCNLCSAQYPTQQGLTQHKQTFHKESGSELVLPVVDMKQPGVLGRLANLGVNYYVPLSQLNSSGGYFGLPLVTVDANGRTPLLGTQAMGASNCLSLGPLRQLPR